MKDFSINFKLWHGLKSNDIAALSNSLSRMARLSKLYLNSLGSPTFDQTSLRSLANSLQSLTKLQKLHLQFLSYDGANPGCFDIISKAFENSPTLSNLILDFSRALVVSEAAQNLLLSLQTLTNLSKLDINLSCCQHVNNDVIQSLGQGITKLTNLSSLKLNFSQCPAINGQGLIFLTDILKNLPSLKIFELILTNRPLKSAFLSFSEALEHLVNLSKLRLNFGFSKDLENPEIKALARSLQKIENLEYLELNLSCSLHITDEGLHDLASQIGNLRSLKMLSLNFYGCHKITSEGFQYLKSQLAQLESLKKTYLNFPSVISSDGFTRPREQKPSEKSLCSLI